MEPVTLLDESRHQGSFYVPRFELRIDGAGLPRNVLRDVIELTYKDDVKKLDSFELTVNNWDADKGRFKYVGSESKADLEGGSPDSIRYRLFEPCHKQVVLRMGYRGELPVLLTGNFTTMEPNFPSSGAPTLSVRGLNVLHQLRRKQYTYSWVKRRDSEIAREIAQLKDDGAKRFPLPIRIDEAALAKEPRIDYVAEKNQHDIDFLLARARLRGYVVVIREAEPGGGGERHLYFGPSDGGEQTAPRDVTFALEWGKSLIDFKPTLTTANQVKSVTVNGWDRKTKKPIKEKVSIDDKEFKKRNRDLRHIQKCDPREEVVVDRPVFSKKEAKKLALDMLTDRDKEMVKASGTTIGLPDLRAGRKVEIRGLGSRFSGTYFVTETTHKIGDGGYTTAFKARREDEKGGETT